jgi:two-component system, LytTR family, sensor kinase
MKFFWRYIFPILFGLLVYTSIRLVNDTTAHAKFWIRAWQTNFIEITSVIAVCFVFQAALNRLILYFNKKQPNHIRAKTILKEFGLVFLVTLLISNALIIPMVALTDDGLQLNDFVIVNIIPTLFILLYFAIVRGNQYLTHYMGQKIQLEKITNDHLQTELKFLKAQYHPHFLFNALNTIYFQIDENRDEAKKTIEKFSALLRYQLYDQQQTVLVKQEIEYLKNFIEIQKTRKSEKLQLTTFFDADLNEQQIYPLLFLPLIENAFKYIGGDYLLTIEAKLKNRDIEFTVVNSLPLSPMPEKQNGIGLDNLKRRLTLLYPQKHDLSIEKSNYQFKAILKLVLS